ncbi:hypothetical protein RALTA_B0436 [Cupriavidus taiwanensis LMG 19424]|uniref:Uncharacterized protein n=1 Tax=Cupriavidus taiwanensis (strain DSM 17343 / BCRC 17206 / CCUG 44338 / CIP 107171 / LMG 19424 / R1) TaxID=977880 RepID=B2AIN1_CUPTR|nr:hypothetical protein RALTA_B0436 [Cupriavidus taiwanensis LMG 19424]
MPLAQAYTTADGNAAGVVMPSASHGKGSSITTSDSFKKVLRGNGMNLSLTRTLHHHDIPASGIGRGGRSRRQADGVRCGHWPVRAPAPPIAAQRARPAG